MLILLWLIGESPPVRARKIPSPIKYPYQNKNSKNSEFRDSSKFHVTQHANKITLTSLPPISEDKKTNVIKNNIISHGNQCYERRTLKQIVIDTPNIYEVTVVSKSVAGWLLIGNDWIPSVV